MKLNLGCGGFPKEGFLNLDSRGDLQTIFIQRYLKGTDPLYTIGQWKFQDKFPDTLDGVIDAITISHSLMYLKIEEYEEVLKELYRILKPKGVLRITEDNCEQEPEKLKIFGLPWGNPASAVGAIRMRKELEKVFQRVYDVKPEETKYKDSSLIHNLHGSPPRVFHMEGVKD